MAGEARVTQVYGPNWHLHGTTLTMAAATDDALIAVGKSASTQKAFDLKWLGGDASGAAYWYFDASAKFVFFEDCDLKMNDSDDLVFGDGASATAVAGDVKMRWDGTDFDVLCTADDTVIKWGDGTTSFDIWWYGNIPTAYRLWDASASELRNFGPVRLTSNHLLGSRYELRWVAGQRGKPSINADINSAIEATREIADPDFEVLGTNATSDDVTFYVEGGVTIETDGADGDEVIILPHLDANQSAWAQVTWGTDQQTEWECDISTSTNITNTIVWAGLKLTNTEVTATDNDQVFFRYEDDVNSGKWQAIYSIGGTDTATDSTVTVATSTRYHLKVAIDSSRIARMYINGVLVNTSTALTNTTDLIPYIGVAADGAGAAKKINVHGQTISRVIA